MKRKLWAIILSACMAVTLLPTQVFAAPNSAATPINLQWGRLYSSYELGDIEFGDYETIPGLLSWEVNDAGDKFKYYYQCKIYNKEDTTNPIYNRQWIVGGARDSKCISISEGLNTLDVDSGTYYFTVQAVDEEYNPIGELSTSPDFQYTKPSEKLNVPASPTWNDAKASFSDLDDMSDVFGYEIHYYFTKSKDNPSENDMGEHNYFGGVQYGQSVEASLKDENAWGNIRDSQFKQGNKYCFFKVRFLSKDINHWQNSDWVESPVLDISNLAGDVQTFAEWTSFYPSNGATNVGYKENAPIHYQITFDREIANDGALAEVNLDSDVPFAVYRASDDKLIYKPSQYASGDFKIVYQSENILSITPLNNHTLLEPDTEYYITMGEGFVTFKDGSTNQAIVKGDWRFKTKQAAEFTFGRDTLKFNNSPGIGWPPKYSIYDEYLDAILEGQKFSDKQYIKNIVRGLILGGEKDIGGSCFGMSSVMRQAFLKDILLSYFDKDATYAVDLDYPKDNKTVSSLITYYHLIQGTSSYAKQEKECNKNGQAWMLREIVEKTKAEPVLVNFQFLDGTKKKHAILAYDVEDCGNYYNVKTADPNGLLLGPGAMKISKSYTLEGIEVQFKMGTASYANPQLLSVLNSSDGILESYNIQQRLGLEQKAKKDETFSRTQSDPLVILTTNYPSFSVKSNSCDFSVINGIASGTKISGVIGPLANDEDGTAAKIYLPAYEDYTVTPLAANEGEEEYQTFMYYDDGTGDGAYTAVSTGAPAACTFHCNGTVDISNNTATSIYASTTINDIMTPWHTVAVNANTNQLSISPTETSTAISSASALGDIEIYGEDDRNTYSLPLKTDEKAVHVEEAEISDVPHLVIKNESNTILASEKVGYAVQFRTNGGSLIDSYTNVVYGSTISEPADPTYSGHKFSGWYKDSACTEGNKWNFAMDTVTENTTLYAKWVISFGGNNTPSGGGGGGGSASATPIPVPTVPNGKVSITPARAAKGDKVTVTLAPDSGYTVKELTVTDASGVQISLTKLSDTQYTFLMPSGKVSVNASFEAMDTPPTPPTFTDVPTDAYYSDAVNWAVSKGITNGTGNGQFSPNASCTRAEMVTFLWRAAGSPAPIGSSSFSDVPSDAYYHDAVLWAAEQGITTGTGSGIFDPGSTVTRAQTVTFLYRFAGSPDISGGSAFGDVASGTYYTDAVAWAVANGITNGNGPNSFGPAADCSRGQIVTFLFRQMAG